MSRICKDHLENTYRSEREMCAKWGVSQTAFHYRIERGCSLEEALTGAFERNWWKGSLKDLTGKRFGNLVVIGRAPDAIQPNGEPRRMWNCKCDC